MCRIYAERLCRCERLIYEKILHYFVFSNRYTPISNSFTKHIARIVICGIISACFGAWRSPASALAWGARGRRFESSRPDRINMKHDRLEKSVMFFYACEIKSVRLCQSRNGRIPSNKRHPAYPYLRSSSVVHPRLQPNQSFNYCQV